MPAKTVRRSSPPSDSVSFSSFLALGTSSAAMTRATRRSTFVKSSIEICSATSGSASNAAPLSSGTPAAAEVSADSLAAGSAGCDSVTANSFRLSSIIASTWAASTRFIMCVN